MRRAANRARAPASPRAEDVNSLIKQWGELNKMMGKMRGMMGGGNRKQAKRQMQQMMRQMGGGMPGGMGMPGGKLPF